jgi:hypothetical protein
MTLYCIRALLLALLLVAARATEAGVVYDAAADFSATSNPNGVWSYGESATLGSPFQIYTQAGPDNADLPPANLLDTWNNGTRGNYTVPSVVHNGTAIPISFNGTITVQPGELGFHPGPLGQYSIVRFTTAIAGSYTLASAFQPMDSLATTDVHVLLNGVSIFDGFVNPGDPTSFNTGLVLGAGDRIDFAVGIGSNGNYSNDATGLSATLTTSAVPEAPTLVLGLASLAGFLLVGLRRVNLADGDAHKADDCP